MQVKTLISILAVSTALAFAGPASAQTMNGNAISADDLPKVQARCDELSTAATTSPAADQGADKTTTEAGQADATLNSAPQTNAADEATTSSVDLDTLTLEMCTEAGLSKAM